MWPRIPQAFGPLPASLDLGHLFNLGSKAFFSFEFNDMFKMTLKDAFYPAFWELSGGCNLGASVELPRRPRAHTRAPLSSVSRGSTKLQVQAWNRTPTWLLAAGLLQEALST